jgi:DNA-binding IclR family transcriptional regulator
MSYRNAGMVELDDRDDEVLAVLAEGRANPYLIREETGLDKGDTNTVLNRLARAGYVKQVTRGLYEITESGKRRSKDPRDN